jgi:hypothetical protein
MIKGSLLIIIISAIFSIIVITEPQLNTYAEKDSEKELYKENDRGWEDGVYD